MDKLTKLGFAFTDDDMQLLSRLRSKLEPTLGKTSNVVIVRMALRLLDRQP